MLMNFHHSQVTNFWVPEILNGNYEGEVEQGKRIIDACKKAGVKFLVWRCGFPVSVSVYHLIF
jgi:sialic acid synthase SpsE